jgi:hypothetical protein
MDLDNPGMSWDQMRYIGNAVIAITAVTVLYLILAHRYSLRPYDYLWQGYVCPTADYMHCTEGFEASLMPIHYVDREICADETERTITIEEVAQSFPDVKVDVGFMYGCQRSEYHRSQLTPAQRQKGSVIDEAEPSDVEAPSAE